MLEEENSLQNTSYKKYCSHIWPSKEFCGIVTYSGLCLQCNLFLYLFIFFYQNFWKQQHLGPMQNVLWDHISKCILLVIPDIIIRWSLFFYLELPESSNLTEGYLTQPLEAKGFFLSLKIFFNNWGFLAKSFWIACCPLGHSLQELFQGYCFILFVLDFFWTRNGQTITSIINLL